MFERVTFRSQKLKWAFKRILCSHFFLVPCPICPAFGGDRWWDSLPPPPPPEGCLPPPLPVQSSWDDPETVEEFFNILSSRAGGLVAPGRRRGARPIKKRVREWVKTSKTMFNNDQLRSANFFVFYLVQGTTSIAATPIAETTQFYLLLAELPL